MARSCGSLWEYHTIVIMVNLTITKTLYVCVGSGVRLRMKLNASTAGIVTYR